jgi:hypothetical protein
MYSWSSRLNAISSFTSFVVGGVLIFNFLSRFILPYSPSISISPNKVELHNYVKGYYDRAILGESRNDVAGVTFDLDAGKLQATDLIIRLNHVV